MKKTEIVYVLRRTKEKLISENGFKYPKKGRVECEDRKDNNKCGNGLYGLQNGVGNFDISIYGPRFQVIKVNKKDGFVDLGDKCKFRKGYVVLTTKDSIKAIEYIKSKTGIKEGLQYDYSTKQVVNQGNYSTSKQGNCSTSNQGNYSTSNQGCRSTSNQLYRSTSNQGFYSTSNQWDGSTSNQGDCSVSIVHGKDFIYRNRGKLSAIIMFYFNKMKIFEHGKDYKTNETVYIKDMKIVKRYSGTSDNIKKLEAREVFVFGSNGQGNHCGGAAKIAKEKFGAIEGQSEGLQGQSFAINTMDGIDKIKEGIEKLIKCACENTTKVFLVTKIGCGIAGYKEKEIKSLFNLNKLPANIVLPKGWY